MPDGFRHHVRKRSPRQAKRPTGLFPAPKSQKVTALPKRTVTSLKRPDGSDAERGNIFTPQRRDCGDRPSSACRKLCRTLERCLISVLLKTLGFRKELERRIANIPSGRFFLRTFSSRGYPSPAGRALNMPRVARDRRRDAQSGPPRLPGPVASGRVGFASARDSDEVARSRVKSSVARRAGASTADITDRRPLPADPSAPALAFFHVGYNDFRASTPRRKTYEPRAYPP